MSCHGCDGYRPARLRRFEELYDDDLERATIDDLRLAYKGPVPKGSAKAPPRAEYSDPKIQRASQLVARAEATIRNVLFRRRANGGWDESNDSKDRELLRQAADELDVAADLYEEAGAGVRAGTLHERARHARRGDYKLLAAYD